ncbi:hypothetical protein lerEdw1_011625 [Lerista edwardsae]|nr:hypothetical protein lerEdw1_011625 [Lerista edwardsae]
MLTGTCDQDLRRTQRSSGKNSKDQSAEIKEKVDLIENSLGRAQKIEQSRSATALDGTSYNLTCKLSSITTEKLLWYRQIPGQGPQYIAGAYSGRSDESDDPKSTLYFQKDKESNALVLHQVTLADAAVYFCALIDAQCVISRLSQYKNPSEV